MSSVQQQVSNKNYNLKIKKRYKVKLLKTLDVSFNKYLKTLLFHFLSNLYRTKQN